MSIFSVEPSDSKKASFNKNCIMASKILAIAAVIGVLVGGLIFSIMALPYIPYTATGLIIGFAISIPLSFRTACQCGMFEVTESNKEDIIRFLALSVIISLQTLAITSIATMSRLIILLAT